MREGAAVGVALGDKVRVEFAVEVDVGVGVGVPVAVETARRAGFAVAVGEPVVAAAAGATAPSVIKAIRTISAQGNGLSDRTVICKG